MIQEFLFEVYRSSSISDLFIGKDLAIQYKESYLAIPLSQFRQSLFLSIWRLISKITPAR